MAEQRQPFRFRLPWLPQPAAPTAPPPTADTQTPVQPIATVPIQRPAFRPAGIAPVQPPPPQAQPAPRTESQPPSRPASLPPSPPRPASQPQPVAQTAPQPRSPPRLASQPAGQTFQLPTTQESSQLPPPSSTQPPSSVSQRGEQKPALSQPESQKPQSKKEITQPSQPESQEPQPRKEIAQPSQRSTHRMDRNTVGESRQKPGIFNRERAPLHKEIREDISRFVQKLGIGHPEQITSEEPVSVITLAGENRGAFMQLGSESAEKEGSVHIQRRYKTNQDKSAETTTDAEGSFEGRSSKYPMTKEDLGEKAYINSNIQSINNSILSDSSVTEKNPGVHFNLSHPVESIKSNDKTESFEAHKAEFNITPAEKLTYEPTVRRRCLRGLFMESSDSDPDNPEKPRRHGCRYGCGEKSKDKEIGIL